jgi:hypothetical protein
MHGQKPHPSDVFLKRKRRNKPLNDAFPDAEAGRMSEYHVPFRMEAE